LEVSTTQTFPSVYHVVCETLKVLVKIKYSGIVCATIFHPYWFCT